MVQIIGPPPGATRCLPITEQLRELLRSAAEATGVERIVIFSGGQTSNHAPHLQGAVCGWIGSRRHDNGRAADIQLIKNGTTLTFSNISGAEVADFVTACAARGASGIGAATDYMGPRSIHVGFGQSTSDTSKLTWGRDGLSVNAPNWLRAAAQKGWDNPVPEFLLASGGLPASPNSIVNARDGLWLRRGPGLGFDRAKLLAAGTQLKILGHDGDWARVDLVGDGLIDGHVAAAFVSTSEKTASHDLNEGLEEFVSDEAIAEFLNASEVQRFPLKAPVRKSRVRLRQQSEVPAN